MIHLPELVDLTCTLHEAQVSIDPNSLRLGILG